jgi:hypothetical protein
MVEGISGGTAEAVDVGAVAFLRKGFDEEYS